MATHRKSNNLEEQHGPSRHISMGDIKKEDFSKGRQRKFSLFEGVKRFSESNGFSEAVYGKSVGPITFLELGESPVNS